MNRMQELVAALNKHSYNYHVLDNPTISDAEYDKLYDELVNLENVTGVVLKDSPTQRVGDEVLTGFKKHTHKTRLYSLDKCKTENELCEWVDKVKKQEPKANFSLEYKFDGLTIICIYKNGLLQTAATRGNGSVGEDVTAQVKTIKSVPLSIDFKGELIVRGEGMMTLSNLKKYNKTADEPLKNARNAVSGAIRNLDPKTTAKRNLDWFCYDICYIENKQFESQQEVHDFLRNNKFKVDDYFKILSTGEQIAKEINTVDKNKKNLDILMDGMVIKLNQIALRDEFGFTSRFPKWAIAYKFEAQEITSKLNNVIWQVGRTGKITPIAEVEPVELAGATVTRATLNNFGDIERKDIELGSRVFIRRSNEVIPEILGIAEKDELCTKVKKPTNCPSCNHKLVEIGANLFCTNTKNCKEQIVDRLCHFASRDAMNIEGFSDQTALLLFEELGVNDVSKLYDVTKQQLLTLPSFKNKKADNLIESIQKSKLTTLDKFIYALGIQNVGKKTAKDLAKYFASLNDVQLATVEILENIREIGKVVAKNITDYFSDTANIQLLNMLFDKGVKIEKQQTNQKNTLKGLTFVITGTLTNYTRQEISDIIEISGGNVSSSVSKNTSYLICGEDAGSKLVKAQNIGVKIISESEFKNLFNL